MDRVCDDTYDSEFQLEVAKDLLALSSARLRAVALSGHAEAIESATTAFRLARIRFLVAEAEYMEISASPAFSYGCGAASSTCSRREVSICECDPPVYHPATGDASSGSKPAATATCVFATAMPRAGS
jgi:hypothetical protein